MMCSFQVPSLEKSVQLTDTDTQADVIGQMFKLMQVMCINA